ncbi:MAG: hypothetical protein AB7E75_02995 [Candidatus Methanomethylophilaceae archaeon]
MKSIEVVPKISGEIHGALDGILDVSVTGSPAIRNIAVMLFVVGHGSDKAVFVP